VVMSTLPLSEPDAKLKEDCLVKRSAQQRFEDSMRQYAESGLR